MVALSGTLSHLNPINVLLVGDLMLDTYTTGSVTRTSPEAPVMVLTAKGKTERAGGAGNVALNLAALGAKVRLLGRVGNDEAAEILLQDLQQQAIDTDYIVSEECFVTPVKNRFIAGGQQVLRVDQEEVKPLATETEQQLIERLPELLKDIDIVAISDYAKGMLTPGLLKTLISAAWAQGVRVLVDPKGKDFSKYAGVSVIKPNMKEAALAAGLEPSAPLATIAEQVLRQCQAEYLFITRSEGGISVFDQRLNRGDFPARVREVTDVTGAGDTVLAIVTCALANGMPIADAAQLANVAAGIAIEGVGCVRVTLADLAQRLLELDVVNKVFHEQHLFALKQALAGSRFTVLGLHSAEGVTEDSYKVIRKLARGGHCKVVIYVRDEEPSEAFVQLLESLSEVAFITLKSESLISFAEEMQPDEVFAYEKGALHKLEHSKALI